MPHCPNQLQYNLVDQEGYSHRSRCVQDIQKLVLGVLNLLKWYLKFSADCVEKVLELPEVIQGGKGMLQ